MRPGKLTMRADYTARKTVSAAISELNAHISSGKNLPVLIISGTPASNYEAIAISDSLTSKQPRPIIWRAVKREQNLKPVCDKVHRGIDLLQNVITSSTEQID